MKRLEKILDALEKHVKDTVYDDLYNIQNPIQMGNVTFWVEDYDVHESTFTVCIDGKNCIEHPNVEEYLSRKLGERIPDLGWMLEEEEREKREWTEEIHAMRRELCESYGWICCW